MAAVKILGLPGLQQLPAVSEQTTADDDDDWDPRDDPDITEGDD